MESGDFTGTIEVKCEELGTFMYDVTATVIPPRVERIVKFKAELGETATRTVSFQNVFQAPIELMAKVMFPIL